MPPGAQIVVLNGNPSQPGAQYVIGLKMPDGYWIPPFWHTTDFNLVVVKGAFGMGLGEKIDQSQGRELPAGSFSTVSKNVRHFEWAKGETIIYAYGFGPLETIYAHPARRPEQEIRHVRRSKARPKFGHPNPADRHCGGELLAAQRQAGILVSQKQPPSPFVVRFYLEAGGWKFSEGSHCANHKLSSSRFYC